MHSLTKKFAIIMGILMLGMPSCAEPILSTGTDHYKPAKNTTYELEKGITMTLYFEKDPYLDVQVTKICITRQSKYNYCRNIYHPERIPLQMHYEYIKWLGEDDLFFEFQSIDERNTSPEGNEYSIYASFKEGHLFFGKEELNCLYNHKSENIEEIARDCMITERGNKGEEKEDEEKKKKKEEEEEESE